MELSNSSSPLHMIDANWSSFNLYIHYIPKPHPPFKKKKSKKKYTHYIQLPLSFSTHHTTWSASPPISSPVAKVHRASTTAVAASVACLRHSIPGPSFSTHLKGGDMEVGILGLMKWNPGRSLDIRGLKLHCQWGIWLSMIIQIHKNNDLELEYGRWARVSQSQRIILQLRSEIIKFFPDWKRTLQSCMVFSLHLHTWVYMISLSLRVA